VVKPADLHLKYFLALVEPAELQVCKYYLTFALAESVKPAEMYLLNHGPNL
jgi:hypothetical protein